jgi:hypothetical protein
MCRHIRADSAVQLHVLQHVEMDLCTDAVERADGTIGCARHFRRAPLFYVHPRTRLLCANRRPPRWGKWRKRQEARRREAEQRAGVVVVRDRYRQYRRLNGTWWELTFRPLPQLGQHAAPPPYDVVLRRWVVHPDQYELHDLYGAAVYAASKRPLTRAEIRYAGLRPQNVVR